MNIEITTDETPLSRNVWTFNVSTIYSPTIDVKLEKYTKWTRPSTRHRKWVAAGRWPELRGYGAPPPCECPSMPSEVEAELRKRIAAAVRFDWSAA